MIPTRRPSSQCPDALLERHVKLPGGSDEGTSAIPIFMHNRLLTAKYTGLLAKLQLPRLRTTAEAAARVSVLGRCRTLAPAKKTMALVSGGAVWREGMSCTAPAIMCLTRGRRPTGCGSWRTVGSPSSERRPGPNY